MQRLLARPWLVVATAAVLVRVCYVLSIRHAFFFDHLVTEPAFYDGWARAIGSGDAPVQLPFDEAPGYAYFVAAIYSITGASVLAVALVQAVLGAAACAAISHVARRIGGDRAGWIAGGIAALYGPFIYFTGQLEPAALAVCAVSGVLLAVPAAADASSRRWLLAGAACALAVVVRSELVVIVPFAVAHARWIAGWRAALRVALVPVALVALSFAANAIASGHPVLLSNGAGVNLWLGNNPDADGVDPFVHGRLARVVAEVEAATEDHVDRDRAFRAHAELSAPLLAKKLVWTFSARELPNAADITWQTEHSWLFHRPWFPLAFSLVFPLALCGGVLAGRRWRDHVVLLGPVAAAVAACVVFFTNARFRLVMVPSLIVLAALAAEPLALAVRHPGRDVLRAARALLAVAAGIAIAWPSYYDVSHFRVAQIDVNTGELEAAAGHYEAAATYLRSGVEHDPDDAAARAELDRVLEILAARAR